MLSRTLERTLHHSLSLARDRRHEYATLEHLLLGLADDDDAAPLLRACGVELGKLRADLTEFLDNDLAGLATDPPVDPKPTAGFQRVVQRAAIQARSEGRRDVTGADVLVSLFSERESFAVGFLQSQDMTRLDAVNFRSHGIHKPRTILWTEPPPTLPAQGIGPMSRSTPRVSSGSHQQTHWIAMGTTCRDCARCTPIFGSWRGNLLPD